MINNVVLVGRAGRDPEIREFNNGNKLAELSMAVQRNKEETDWFDIKIWGKAADTAANYIKKGHIFGVIGRLQQEKWESEGQKRSKVTVHVHSISLSPKSMNSEQTTQEPKSNSKATSDEDLDDIFGSGDEIPF